MDKAMNRLQTSIVVLLVLLVLPSGAGAVGDEGLSIRVRPYSRVTGQEVCLADIAEISGTAPVIERLKRLEITASPQPGKKRRFPGSMVEAKLRTISRNNPNKFDISVPEYVLVERDCQEIPEAELKKMFYGFIEKKAGERTFRIRDVSIKGNRQLALGPVTYRIDDRNLRNIEGRVAITIHAKVPSERDRKVFLSGWVDVYDSVVCASRDIARGELIGKKDLVLERKNLTRTSGDLIYDITTVTGTQARTHIEKGDYLRNSMVEEAPLVRKGDVVKIIARSGRLTVVTTGISRQDGVMGEQIQVENTESNKQVAGRVVDRQTVEIVF